jgi:hypothetical protein
MVESVRYEQEETEQAEKSSFILEEMVRNTGYACLGDDLP